MKKKFLLTLTLLAAFALIASACNHDNNSSSGQSSKGILQQVIDRDSVRCGSRDGLQGFGEINSAGENVGFDIDFCRVIAAAVLGDADKVDFVILNTIERFTALQSGSIDVLIRNTTWTATRDGNEAVNFVFTTYYDGQGIMVPASSNITTLEDLADANICVTQGTTHELNLASVFGQRDINFNPLAFEDTANLQAAYDAGQCEAWTSDVSQLTSFKLKIEDAGGDTQRILQEIISKEPLGPSVPDGDTEWAQVVRWATMSTVQAWEFGITQQNIATFTSQSPSDNPIVARFLGKTDSGAFDPGLGLPSDFAVKVITQVGNYEEIYKRNIRGLPLSGSLNDLWSNGGLLYTPPFS